MRRSAVGLALLIFLLTLSPTSSHAGVRPFRYLHSTGTGRGIDLQWSDAGYSVWLYGANGTGLFTEAPNPMIVGTTDRFGCLRIETDAFLELGCGYVSIDVDASLETASMSGPIDTDLYDNRLGAPAWIGPSKVQIDLAATATSSSKGVRVQVVSPGLHWYLRTDSDAEHAQVSGSVTSIMIGGPSGTTDNATIFDGQFSWASVGF